MSDVSKATKRLYKETSEFVLLGLTGRTGSGCSTAAEILSSTTENIPETSRIYDTVNDRIKYKIIREYSRRNRREFVCIQVKTVITAIILELNYEQFLEICTSILGKDGKSIRSKLTDFEVIYATAHVKIKEYKSKQDNTDELKSIKKDLAWSIYFEFLPDFCEKLKDVLHKNIGVESYTTIYQKVGDNIRASGQANLEHFDEEKIFTIPRIINKLVKVIRERKPEGAFITIDAIRNPLEAIYFHQRYSGFYLVSINTPNNERLSHLRESHKFSDEQIKALDNKEYPKKLIGKEIYISQNVQKCIEIADIHINNPDRQKYNTNELKSQLIWYVSLILHPGLVTPTSIERSMQLAISAKLNSGCISRQVGAVVTDSNFSIKAVGWNNTPEGQMPCVLRNAKDLIDGGEEHVYSLYERTSEDFRTVLQNTFRGITSSPSSIESLDGRNLSYCFKDLQNEVDGEKNQVHTRSLHAEENAFLQIAKYGGGGVKGGVLFTTASPCELCSKKAYQLGIEKIVYIDPYPGIARQNILESGEKTPTLILFSGALGRAYHRLYQPIMAYKDEIQMLTGFSISGGTHRNKRELRIKQLEEKNKQMEEELLHANETISKLSDH